ncbi:MAG: TRAP transporter small permease, partial [Planctomycetes bacterium]|nr:TRAP transporter small permease [Planctomycetota bacterium]
CFSWVVFVGAAPAYKRNLHSGIDMVIKMFPEGVRQIVAVLGMVITLICCIIMVYLSYIFSIEAWEKYTPVLYIRYTFIDLSVTVGFFFTCVHCVRFIINMLRYGDYAKQIPIYPDIYDLDVLVSGACDTEFHAESQRLRELAARKNGGVDEFNRRNT